MFEARIWEMGWEWRWNPFRLLLVVSEPSPLYDNNHYHEECLRCNSCGLNLTGINQKRARRFKNHILCDLHFADVALMECSDFMQQLRSFKPQSLGSAVARRKSSTTLIFPLPPQACSGELPTSPYKHLIWIHLWCDSMRICWRECRLGPCSQQAKGPCHSSIFQSVYW